MQTIRRLAYAALSALASLAVLAASGAAHAAASLDPTFGVQGIATFALPGANPDSVRVTHGTVDPFYRTLVVGHRVVGTQTRGFVVRRNFYGQADASLAGGYLEIPPSNGYAHFEVTRVVAMADGGFVIGGTERVSNDNSDGVRIRVCRYTDAGTAFSPYGTNGCLVLDMRDGTNIEFLVDLKLHTNSSQAVIVLARVFEGDYHLAVKRVLSSGVDDVCFANATCVGTNDGQFDPWPVLTSEVPTDLAVNTQTGRIYVIGADAHSQGRQPFIGVLRFDGTIDVAFSLDGLIQLDVPSSPLDLEIPRASAIDPGGNVFIGIESEYAADKFIGRLMKISPEGFIQGGLNEGTSATFFYNDVAASNTVRGMVALDDGTVLIAGTASADECCFDGNAGIVRFLGTGQLDERFGFDGAATFDNPALGENSRDQIVGMGANAREITLIGDTQPAVGTTLRQMAMRVRNDELFNDGFE